MMNIEMKLSGTNLFFTHLLEKVILGVIDGLLMHFTFIKELTFM